VCVCVCVCMCVSMCQRVCVSVLGVREHMLLLTYLYTDHLANVRRLSPSFGDRDIYSAEKLYLTTACPANRLSYSKTTIGVSVAVYVWYAPSLFACTSKTSLAITIAM
jgi:hypothetical protein